MLVLSRKIDEYLVIPVVIGGKVVEFRFLVIEIRGNKTRIAAQLPREIPVHRGEVWERIQDEAGGEVDLSDYPAVKYVSGIEELPIGDSIFRDGKLILSRERNDWIIVPVVIDGQIVELGIVVVEIRGDKVRLGAQLPKEFPVHRSEVWEDIKRQEDDISKLPRLMAVPAAKDPVVSSRIVPEEGQSSHISTA